MSNQDSSIRNPLCKTLLMLFVIAWAVLVSKVYDITFPLRSDVLVLPSIPLKCACWSALVMFQPGFRLWAKPSQAQLGRARPGQSHGLNMALARPEILESQSHWPRPGPYYKSYYKSWGLRVQKFSTCRRFSPTVAHRWSSFPLYGSSFAYLDFPEASFSLLLKYMYNVTLCGPTTTNIQLFVMTKCWPYARCSVTLTGLTLVAQLCLNSSHSGCTLFPANHPFCTQNVHPRYHPTTCQGDRSSLKLFVRCHTEGIQRQ